MQCQFSNPLAARPRLGVVLTLHSLDHFNTGNGHPDGKQLLQWVGVFPVGSFGFPMVGEADRECPGGKDQRKTDTFLCQFFPPLKLSCGASSH